MLSESDHNNKYLQMSNQDNGKHSKDLFKIDLDQNTKVSQKEAVDRDKNQDKTSPQRQKQSSENPPKKISQKQDKKEHSISQIENALISKDPKQNEKKNDEQKGEQPKDGLYKWPSEYDQVSEGKQGKGKNSESKQVNEGSQRQNQDHDKEKKPHYQEKKEKPKYREKIVQDEKEENDLEDNTKVETQKEQNDGVSRQHQQTSNTKYTKQGNQISKQKSHNQNISKSKVEDQKTTTKTPSKVNNQAKPVVSKQFSSNQTIELYYWPIKGLAERIRLLLEYLGIKYETKPFNTQQQWETAKQKSTAPILYLPYIKDGNDIIVQSDAIMIHLILKADREELLGRNNKQKVDIAQIRGHFGTFHSEYIMLVYGDYEHKKAAFVKNAKSYLTSFSNFIGENEYICGQITYVDFLLAEFFNILKMIDPSLMSEFPKLDKLRQKIFNEPRLREYLASEEYSKIPLNSEHAKWNGQQTSVQKNSDIKEKVLEHNLQSIKEVSKQSVSPKEKVEEKEKENEKEKEQSQIKLSSQKQEKLDEDKKIEKNVVKE